MKYLFSLSIMLSMTSCTTNTGLGNAASAMQYPDLNHEAVIKKWGYPAEIIIKKRDVKLGDYIATWVYYIQDSDGLVSPVFFNFRQGKLLSSNSFVVSKGHYRIMNTEQTEDLKLILSERDRIKKTWTVWTE